jgi:hypothetical protein
MDLFLARDSVAINGQPSKEFMIGFRIFGGRRFDPRFNVGTTINIQVYALHNDSFEVTYHPGGKRFVLQKSIPQGGKLKVTSNPY